MKGMDMLAQPSTHYARQFYVGGRGYGKTVMMNAAVEAQRQRAGERMADWAETYLDIKIEDWQARWAAGVLGHWDYTPADELRDRLNDRLQGKTPALAINTRYWRNL